MLIYFKQQTQQRQQCGHSSNSIPYLVVKVRRREDANFAQTLKGKLGPYVNEYLYLLKKYMNLSLYVFRPNLKKKKNYSWALGKVYSD